jgi:hypothetical protein
MVRKDRSDIRIGKLAEKHKIPAEMIRNKSGRKTRSDAKLGTVAKRHEK